MSASGKNMNGEEYKEAIAADPSGSFEGADHAAACESCAAFMAEMQAFDAKIAQALAIDVPELAMPELEPVEDDNVVNLPFSRNRKTWEWMSIAAGFALAAIIGVQMFGTPIDSGLSLEEEILAHLEHEPFAFDETVRWIIDAAKGLAHAHERGVIHRDVKPENLFRERSGRIQILDFGIARFVGDAPGAELGQTLSEMMMAEDRGEFATAPGAVMGTPQFMSPEQCRDSSTCDARSDVYSLGCSLYQLLTGRPVFEGNPTEVLRS